MIDIHRANHRPSLFNYLRDRVRVGIAAAIGDGPGSIEAGDDVGFAFVVGCGHSGTSLTASRLGLHAACHLVDGETLAFSPSRTVWSCRRSVREWVHEARTAGRSMIVEKTPKHVHSLARIRRLLPAARVIAVVRNPLDNVASLKERYGSLTIAIERWDMDNSAVADAVSRGEALLLRYEDLTASPEAAFRMVFSYLGLPWDPDVLTSGKSAYTDAKRMFRARLDQVAQPIVQRTDRWRQVLDDREAAEVTARTADTASRIGYPAGERQRHEPAVSAVTRPNAGGSSRPATGID